MRLVRIIALAAILPCAAAAQSYDGYCFAGDGCTGPVPLDGATFYTCERNCVMENPVTVRGMDATLWDVTCRGDDGTGSYRLMMAWLSVDGRRSLLAVRTDRAEFLERCE